MGEIFHFRRQLLVRPVPVQPSGIELRTYREPADIPLWLDIRHRAFAAQGRSVGPWSPDDFARELLEKPWWSPAHLWFAVPREDCPPAEPAVGAVALARRGASPVVHWLAVLPEWRRRGIGRFLVESLERACWEAGDRAVFLETHSAWEAAARLYESLGYERV